MRRYRQRNWAMLALLTACLVLAGSVPVLAATTRSDNYEASEAEFGAGAALDTCSGQYCAHATIGDISGVDGSSSTYSAAFGPLGSDGEPMLEVMIEPGNANLGILGTDATATRTMVLHVRSHLAGGYLVQISGDPPSYSGHTLAAPSVATASSKGTEQFALNAVANSEPEVGEDPVLVLSDEPLLDVIQPKYATPNAFAYISGDVIAQTLSESSQIRYTISMIVNVAGSTPAGHYSGDFSAIVTPVF